jgi:hypothetical protein
MTTQYVNPWESQGLRAYDVWAKDDMNEDRSLNVVARDPEHAIELWRQHYRGWPMDNIESGPKVRAMGLPPSAGAVEWCVGKAVEFKRVDYVSRGAAACMYKNVKWVRA